MARFPISEAEIVALAALVADGLEQSAADFPSPPIPAAELRAKVDSLGDIRLAVVAAETAFREQRSLRLVWVSGRFVVYRPPCPSCPSCPPCIFCGNGRHGYWSRAADRAHRVGHGGMVVRAGRWRSS